jgi:hypothetical protein
MTRFRKKPVVVEAEQFTLECLLGHAPLPVGVTKATDGDPGSIHGCVVRWYVVTAHGQRAYLAHGDWVIAEPDGRGFYPCKPDIFRATYQPVDDAGNALEWGQ